MPQIVAIASDHAGFSLKESLKDKLNALGYQIQDLGTNSEESVDYPDFGTSVADCVANKKAEFGVAICGSGIGISIAANRNKKIRAALCFNKQMAQLARQHNDANVIALGARFTSDKEALDCVQTFLTTKFANDRHTRRVEKLSK